MTATMRARVIVTPNQTLKSMINHFHFLRPPCLDANSSCYISSYDWREVTSSRASGQEGASSSTPRGWLPSSSSSSSPSSARARPCTAKTTGPRFLAALRAARAPPVARRRAAPPSGPPSTSSRPPPPPTSAPPATARKVTCFSGLKPFNFIPNPYRPPDPSPLQARPRRRAWPTCPGCCAGAGTRPTRETAWGR